jgi:hypothetical protein
MKLESKKNYAGIVEPILLKITTHDGREFHFQQQKLRLQFASFSETLGITDTVQVYMLESHDGGCFFHYMIDKKLGQVIIPPNAIQIDSTHTKVGLGEELQKFFEFLAHKHGFKLVVGLTPQGLSKFNGKVGAVLRSLGWSIGPTIGQSVDEEQYFHLGFHQSTDMGEGLPEYGMEPEYFIPPTVLKPVFLNES